MGQVGEAIVRFLSVPNVHKLTGSDPDRLCAREALVLTGSESGSGAATCVSNSVQLKDTEACGQVAPRWTSCGLGYLLLLCSHHVNSADVCCIQSRPELFFPSTTAN